MTNYEKVLELRKEINERQRRIEMDEEFIEEAYHRIDQLSEEEQRLKNEVIDLHN